MSKSGYLNWVLKMERREFVRFWAKYLKDHPKKAWSQYTKFINALYQNKPNPKIAKKVLEARGKFRKFG